MTGPQHVALVGCGFTGTSALHQLVEGYPVREITIFEASGRFGPGYPYQPDECPDYLINNTTDTMCLVPWNRRGFLEWLQERPGLAPELDEKGHLPRSTFGAFLEDVFASTRTAAVRKGIIVNLVPAEATRMHEDADDRVHIGWDGGEIAADVAILTTGRCPDVDDYDAPPAGASARYIANHIRTRAFDAVPLDATVHVLGASLSAYDVVNRLFSPDTGCRFEPRAGGGLEFIAGPNRRRVVLCSRSGRLKAMQSRNPTKIDRRHFTLDRLRGAAGDGGLDLATVAELIRDEAAEHGAKIDWQSVTEPYRDCLNQETTSARAGRLLEADLAAAWSDGPENFLVDFFANAQVTIWDGFAEGLLTPEEEALYRTKYETAALSYAAACPIPTAEKLLALHRAGRLHVVRGVQDVSLASDGSHYAISHAHGTERADTLVNTTGRVDRQVDSARQPALIRSLVEHGHLGPYRRGCWEMNGAAVDMQTFRAEGARNIYLANMLLWGPGFFTSSAFMMATVVERTLKAIFSKSDPPGSKREISSSRGSTQPGQTRKLVQTS